MKRALKIIGIIVALAAGFHFLTVLCLPRLSMVIACRVIGKNAGGPNVAFHSKPTTEDNNMVVMQNADTLASMCVYDLTEGPVRIRSVVPDTYWSISLYDMDTNNYYVKNDRQVGAGKRAEIIITDKMIEDKTPAGVDWVVSPTMRGVVIFRNLVRNKEDLPALIEIQKKTSCEPLNKK